MDKTKKYARLGGSILLKIEKQTGYNRLQKSYFIDNLRSKRIKERKCISCFYSKQDQSFFLQQTCELCNSIILSPDPGKKSTCVSCSNKYDLCQICLGEIEF